MRIAIHECKHCGEEYHHQWSGNHDVVDATKEYRDQDYCPGCKAAIVCALGTIPVKYVYKPVETDEVDLDTLLRWEKEHLDEQRALSESNFAHLPLMKRIFMRLYDPKMNEYQCVEQVIGREDKRGRIYVYSYWPSNKYNCIITVQMKVKEKVGYKIQK